MHLSRAEGARMTSSPSIGGFQHRDWITIPVEQIAHGIERQMIWGERLMVCRLRIPPHVVTPIHDHPHEQITLVERGRVRFVVGDAELLSAPGDVLHFPSHCRHGATTLEEEAVVIDIFSPVRAEFLTQATGSAR
jgi:quercetin dioxygenase-like cupin family protein